MTQLSTTTDGPSGWQKLLNRLRGINAIYIVVVLLLLAVGLLNPKFVELNGFLVFLRRAAPLMILTAGQLFVIVSGGFDLSVGSIITFVVIAGAMLINNDPTTTWWVILVLLAMGVFIGTINGVIVSYLKVPSLITTLGMLLVIRGAGLYWSGGAPRGYLTDNFRMFGRGNIEPFPIIGQLPYAVVVLIIVGGLATYLFHGTNYGRQLLALGDNPRAARLSGVKASRIRILAFIISAVSAVIAGILLGGFAGVNIKAGEGMELQAISAAVLGGAMLLGGRGSVVAAMAGAMALQLLFTLLNLLGMEKPLRDAVQGIIIIGAVALASLGTRRSK